MPLETVRLRSPPEWSQENDERGQATKLMRISREKAQNAQKRTGKLTSILTWNSSILSSVDLFNFSFFCIFCAFLAANSLLFCL